MTVADRVRRVLLTGTGVPPSRWCRTRLLGHGVVTGLLAGVVAGVNDAVSSGTGFLDARFLWATVLAWSCCCLAALALLGGLAAAVADQSRRWCAPERLAATITSLGLVGPGLLLVLVALNVSWLGDATSGSSLLVDGAVCLLGLGLTILLERWLERRMARHGLVGRLLTSPGGVLVICFPALLVAHFGWSGQRCAVGPPEVTAAAEQPNVLLVLIDTLRRDHLSGEGYGRPTSPALDRLAVAGTRFTGCQSQSSFTKPSVASLLCSRYVSGHGTGNMRSVLPDQLLTLPELFHDAGYRTAMVVANPVVSREHGYAQGAELFVALGAAQLPQSKLAYGLAKIDEIGVPVAGALRSLLLALERRCFAVSGAEVTSMAAPEAVKELQRWLGDLGDSPFFAYLHLMEPHAPYLPPPWAGDRFASPAEPFVATHPSKTGVFLPFRSAPALAAAGRAGMIRAYDAEIAAVDQVVGELIGSLRQRQGRDTVIAITADHGEELYEHRAWGHGHSLHRELLEVPLLLLGPGIPKDRVVNDAVQLIDLGPTLAELAGLPVPPSMHGLSLVGLMTGQGPGRTETLAELAYGHTYWARSLQRGSHKLIVSRLGEQLRTELYDLAEDPGETRDLAAAQPQLAGQLRQRLDALIAAAAAGAVVSEQGTIDDITEQRLRALGYVP